MCSCVVRVFVCLYLCLQSAAVLRGIVKGWGGVRESTCEIGLVSGSHSTAVKHCTALHCTACCLFLSLPHTVCCLFWFPRQLQGDMCPGLALLRPVFFTFICSHNYTHTTLACTLSVYYTSSACLRLNVSSAPLSLSSSDLIS